MRFVYPVVIRKLAEKQYHAEFPDLLMCEAEGDSLDDCLRNCNLSAHEWIDVEMKEEMPDFPGASDVDELEARYRDEDNVIIRNILIIYRMRRLG